MSAFRSAISASFRPLAFELIDLLDHVDGDDQVVVFELEDRLRVVDEDVRVEDVVLLHFG